MLFLLDGWPLLLVSMPKYGGGEMNQGATYRDGLHLAWQECRKLKGMHFGCRHSLREEAHQEPNREPILPENLHRACLIFAFTVYIFCSLHPQILLFLRRFYTRLFAAPSELPYITQYTDYVGE